jgi:hypothetical protein
MTEIAFVLSRVLGTSPLRHLGSRLSGHRLIAVAIVAVAFLVTLLTPAGIALAQEAPLHLNPAVEKLAHGQAIIGTQTDDMSLQNCHSLARLNFD